MDIALFSKCLYEALLENDFVNIPGFGCFITEVMPSTFSDKGTTINPPYKKLYFRETIMGDGSAFLNCVKAELPDGADVEAEVSTFISDFKSDLNRRKNIRLGSLGAMRATAQNDYFFVASDDLDIYLDAFGLEPVSIKLHSLSPKVDVEQDLPAQTVVSESESPTESVLESEQKSEMASALLPNMHGKDDEKPVERFSWWIVVLIVLFSLIIFLVVVYSFKESSFSQAVIKWIDAFLDHLLYTEEELRLLGK